MNEDSNKQYQEDKIVDVNKPTESGFNNTYYDNNYNNNVYSDNNETQGEKKNKPIFLILIILFFLILIGFGLYYFVFSKSSNGDAKYEALTLTLCDAAMKYEEKNDGLIDKNNPGSTAYIKLQKLSEAYLIASEIKDPRYTSSLFGKSDYEKYIPLTAYIRLAVASNGEVYCEGLVDTGDDKTAPIVTLTGSEEVIIAVGTNFEDPGATSLDDMDGDISDKISRSGTVDEKIIGEYTITYRSTDTSGNSTTAKRKVVVKKYSDLEPTAALTIDVIAPQIQLKGLSPMCLVVGSKYVEPGVTAIDNVDGNISDRIAVDNGVTGIRTGIFRVTYTVQDTAGHKAIAYRTVEVKTSCDIIKTDPTPVVNVVNTKPTISLIGGSSVIWNLREKYIDRGATAWDKEDGDLTKNIRTDAREVNVDAAGLYKVYYEVLDSQGLTTRVERLITVKDPNANSNLAHFLTIPTNLRIELGSISDIYWSSRIDVPKAVDSNNVSLNVTQEIYGPSGSIVSYIDGYSVGVYKIVYTAKPNGGVSQTVSRNVTIFDSTAPVITAPTEISVKKRTTSCDLTAEDLLSAGVKATDGLNKVAPILKVKTSKSNVCTKTDANGFEAIIAAMDDSSNISAEKTINVVVYEETTSNDVTGVSIEGCGTNNTVNMTVGGTLQLGSTVFPNTASNKSVTWKTLNSNVTVNNGLVTAKTVGSSEVIVRTVDGGKEQTCTVIIAAAQVATPVSSVEIKGCETGELSLQNGKSTTLSALALPTNATNKAITWVSSNANIATINIQGVITTVAKGETILTATSVDGGKTKTCKLNVTDVVKAVDTTAPSKVKVISNIANTTDPYNKSGNWYGGVGKKIIKISVESTDGESDISNFIVTDKDGKKLSEFGLNSSSKTTGELVWSTDINTTIYISALNSTNLTSEKSDPITLRLDNTGPVTAFSKSINDANTWVNTPTYTVEYSGVDNGIGVISRYEYTHDDVKTKIDPKIEGTTQVGNKQFLESNANSYVYVRSVDSLGNVGAWTSNPSYLNMDSVAPIAPTITITGTKWSSSYENIYRAKVDISFGFADGNSTKQSGFGSFTYNIKGVTGTTLGNKISLDDIKYVGDNVVKVTSKDKAGNVSPEATKAFTIYLLNGDNSTSVKGLQELLNKVGSTSCLTADGNFGPLTETAVKTFQNSSNPSGADGIVGEKTIARLRTSATGSCTTTSVSKTENLTISCPKTSIEVGEKIVCSTNEVGVKLSCDNAARSFTTNSGDKTVYCIPNTAGTLTVTAEKSGWNTAKTTVTVGTKPVEVVKEKTDANISCWASMNFSTGSIVTKMENGILMKEYICGSITPGAQLSNNGTTWQTVVPAITNKFYLSSIPGSYLTVYVKADGYYNNSFKTCTQPTGTCSADLNGATYCAAVPSLAMKCGPNYDDTTWRCDNWLMSTYGCLASNTTYLLSLPSVANDSFLCGTKVQHIIGDYSLRDGCNGFGYTGYFAHYESCTKTCSSYLWKKI